MIAMRWQPLLLAFSTMLLGTIAVGSPAIAGSFKINPVNLAIPPDRTTTSLSLTNSASEQVSVRVVAYRWTQVDGADVHDETTNVIVSPPIFTLDPGATQLVRVGMRDRQPGEAYRVVFEEIPRQQVQTDIVQVALRLDLPLFVEAANARPELAWQAWRDGAGAISLEAANSGARHQRVLAIGYDSATDAEPALTREMGVVLPASSRRWLIGNQAQFTAGSVVTLIVRTSEGEEQQTVVVQQR